MLTLEGIPMANPKIELLVVLLDKGRKDTLAAAAKVPEDKRLFQLQEGKATPLWLLGHLANTVNTIVLRWTLEEEGLLTKEQAKLFAPDFARGTPPSSDPAMYPTWEETLDLYDRVMQQAISGISKFSDDDLPKPLPGRMLDQMRAFFSSIEVSLNQMVHHDAYHRGQIGMLAALRDEDADL